MENGLSASAVFVTVPFLAVFYIPLLEQFPPIAGHMVRHHKCEIKVHSPENPEPYSVLSSYAVGQNIALLVLPTAMKSAFSKLCFPHSFNFIFSPFLFKHKVFTLI